ncbi:hypothetical protein [Vagococcus carniphilus]|uniref:hypothetical protein n=1 Tax=Vagococcus carniphilus TaxID=218144 RepID=UPI003B594825
MKDNYIKFYGEADLSTSYDIENVENYIDNFSENSIIDSLNSVLELYNVLQFLNIDYFKEKNPKITDFKSRAYIIFNEFFKNKTIT